MNKKDFKIGVPDVLQILGLSVLGIGIFFGSNYYFLGNLMFSIPFTLGFLLLLFGVVNIITKLKKADKDQQLKKTAELVILILGYGTLSVLSFYPYSHFFNIEFNEKKELKSKFMSEAKNISYVFDLYEVYVSDEIIEPYRLKLTTELNEGTNKNIKSHEDIETFVKIQNSIFYPGDDNNAPIAKEIEEAKNSKAFYEKEIDSWSPFTIISTLQEIPTKVSENLEYINSLGLKKNGEPSDLKANNPFNYDYDIDDEVESTIVSFNDFKIKNVSWIIVLPTLLLLHFLILLPYINAKRHRYNPVSKRKESEMTGILIK